MNYYNILFTIMVNNSLKGIFYEKNECFTSILCAASLG